MSDSRPAPSSASFHARSRHSSWAAAPSRHGSPVWKSSRATAKPVSRGVPCPFRSRWRPRTRTETRSRDWRCDSRSRSEAGRSGQRRSPRIAKGERRRNSSWATCRGRRQVTVSGGSGESLVRFIATATGLPTSVRLFAGNSQSARAGLAVATRPAVLVLDAGGRPVPGIAVSFRITEGGGSIGGRLRRHRGRQVSPRWGNGVSARPGSTPWPPRWMVRGRG